MSRIKREHLTCCSFTKMCLQMIHSPSSISFQNTTSVRLLSAQILHIPAYHHRCSPRLLPGTLLFPYLPQSFLQTSSCSVFLLTTHFIFAAKLVPLSQPFPHTPQKLLHELQSASRVITTGSSLFRVHINETALWAGLPPEEISLVIHQSKVCPLIDANVSTSQVRPQKNTLRTVRRRLQLLPPPVKQTFCARLRLNLSFRAEHHYRVHDCGPLRRSPHCFSSY